MMLKRHLMWATLDDCGKVDMSHSLTQRIIGRVAHCCRFSVALGGRLEGVPLVQSERALEIGGEQLPGGAQGNEPDYREYEKTVA